MVNWKAVGPSLLRRVYRTWNIWQEIEKARTGGTVDVWMGHDVKRMLNMLTNCQAEGRYRPPYLRISDRKLRLFFCACVRLVWNNVTDARLQDAVKCGEAYADFPDLLDLLVMEQIEAARESHAESMRGSIGEEAIARAALHCLTEECLSHTASNHLLPDGILSWKQQADVLRDLIRNPWEPRIMIDHSHISPTARNLANQAYSVRQTRCCYRCDSLGALPPRCPDCNGLGYISNFHLDNLTLTALADALEESGFDRQDILNHLRLPESHWRGCWALDLVLGKN